MPASDANRPGRRARGYDRRWERTRRRYLRTHIMCAEPGCTAPATDVHHKDGLGPSGPRGHDMSNLEGLCHSHHSKRTAREQPGGWNTAAPRRRAPEAHPGTLEGRSSA